MRIVERGMVHLQKRITRAHCTSNPAKRVFIRKAKRAEFERKEKAARLPASGPSTCHNCAYAENRPALKPPGARVDKPRLLERATEVLRARRADLDKGARLLLAQETLTKEQFPAIRSAAREAMPAT